MACGNKNTSWCKFSAVRVLPYYHTCLSLKRIFKAKSLLQNNTIISSKNDRNFIITINYFSALLSTSQDCFLKCAHHHTWKGGHGRLVDNEVLSVLWNGLTHMMYYSKVFYYPSEGFLLETRIFPMRWQDRFTSTFNSVWAEIQRQHFIIILVFLSCFDSFIFWCIYSFVVVIIVIVVGIL